MRFPNSMGSLRQIRTDQAAALLQRRIQMARTADDQKGLEDLRAGEVPLQVVWRGAVPAPNRNAPPLFSVAAPDKPIRVVAFGDFGTGPALMMNGGDLYELAKILGHSNIKMTERYAKLAKNHIARTGDTAGEIWKLMESEAGNKAQAGV